MIGNDWLCANAALRSVATELGTPGLQVLDFFAVFSWTIERNLGYLFVGERDIES
jgi:hypothetical protein